MGVYESYVYGGGGGGGGSICLSVGGIFPQEPSTVDS